MDISNVNDVLDFATAPDCGVGSLQTLNACVWKGLISNDALAVLDETSAPGTNAKRRCFSHEGDRVLGA